MTSSTLVTSSVLSNYDGGFTAAGSYLYAATDSGTDVRRYDATTGATTLVVGSPGTYGYDDGSYYSGWFNGAQALVSDGQDTLMPKQRHMAHSLGNVHGRQSRPVICRSLITEPAPPSERTTGSEFPFGPEESTSPMRANGAREGQSSRSPAPRSELAAMPRRQPSSTMRLREQISLICTPWRTGTDRTSAAPQAVIWSPCRKSTADQVVCGVYMSSRSVPHETTDL